MARADVSKEYLHYPVLAREGQEIAAQTFLPSAPDKTVARKACEPVSESLPMLFTVDEDVRRLAENAQTQFFADGGVFDQIYQPGKLDMQWRPKLKRKNVFFRGSGLRSGFTVVVSQHRSC
jgi:ABC-type sulfate transport system substrate-binding protein